LKDLLGQNLSHSNSQTDIQNLFLKYNLIVLQDGSIRASISYRGENLLIPIEAATAMLLKNLRKSAQSYSESAIHDCVIAVPAFFTIQQRESLIAAAKISGLEVSGLISEQAAVGLAYAMSKSFDSEEKFVLFADFGYSALKLGLISFRDKQLSVLKTLETKSVCGRILESELLKIVLGKAKEKHGADFGNLLETNKKALIRLEKAVEKAKRVLSV
ncbi:Heat shock 105kDa 110kDa protein 1, partial [Bonamia ostreae]